MSITINFPPNFDGEIASRITEDIPPTFISRPEFTLEIGNFSTLACDVKDFTNLIKQLMINNDFDVVFLDQVGGNCKLISNRAFSLKTELFVHPAPFVLSFKDKKTESMALALRNNENSFQALFYFVGFALILSGVLYAFFSNSGRRRKRSQK